MLVAEFFKWSLIFKNSNNLERGETHNQKGELQSLLWSKIILGWKRIWILSFFLKIIILWSQMCNKGFFWYYFLGLISLFITPFYDSFSIKQNMENKRNMWYSKSLHPFLWHKCETKKVKSMNLVSTTIFIFINTVHELLSFS